MYFIFMYFHSGSRKLLHRKAIISFNYFFFFYIVAFHYILTLPLNKFSPFYFSPSNIQNVPFTYPAYLVIPPMQ